MRKRNATEETAESDREASEAENQTKERRCGHRARRARRGSASKNV